MDPVGKQSAVLEKLIATVEPDRACEFSGLLLQEFGSLRETLSAEKISWSDLLAGYPNVIALLSSTKATFDALLEADRDRMAVTSHDELFRQYLLLSMSALPEETLRVFFLDRHGKLMSEDEVTTGSIDRVRIYPRAIFRRALQKVAAKILVVHNHPSGDARPSREDIEVTDILKKLAKFLDVEFVDHLVVGGMKIFSIETGKFIQ